VPDKLTARCSSATELARFLTGATAMLAWAAKDISTHS
jgi:hypothetical protein